MSKKNSKTDFHLSDEALADIARVSVKYLDIKGSGFDKIINNQNQPIDKDLIKGKVKEMTKKFDDEAIYIWAVSNRLIHFEYLLSEIDYAFNFLTNGMIPNWEDEPCNHYVYCQRTIDFYITAVKDRSLQLISSVFCLQKRKTEITERILKDKAIPKDVVDGFKYMRKAMSDFQNRKNVFLHRESIPPLMVSKEKVPSSEEFNKLMKKLRNDWDDCLPQIIILMDCLVTYYKYFKTHFQKQ